MKNQKFGRQRLAVVNGASRELRAEDLKLQREPMGRKGVTRRAFVRTKKIFGWLHDRLYPNCTSIARELEVSVKTAARDVDCLQDEWELPIGYDDRRLGFYLTEKLDRLPCAPVTEAELFAVRISSKVLELYDGMPLRKERRLRRLFGLLHSGITRPKALAWKLKLKVQTIASLRKRLARRLAGFQAAKSSAGIQIQ